MPPQDAPENPFVAPRTDMRTRALSGAVLLAAALGLTIAGGTLFAAAVACVAALVMNEWGAVTRVGGPGPRRAIRPGAVAIVAAATFAMPLDPRNAMILLAVAIVAALVLAAAERRFPWLAAGLAYAGLTGMAFALVRGDGGDGLTAVIFLVVTVAATDSIAYLVGRKVGGPKLWPRVSPKKTWSGALGGLAGGVLFGLVVALAAGLPKPVVIAALAGLLAVVSQGGDLFESAIKRHFQVKDSGTIIPGHGGVMDRVDGLIAAVILACLIGYLRSGTPEGIATGLIRW